MQDSNHDIPQRVIHIEDLYRQKTVEHNDLVTSVAKMDKVPMKFFELAVSCLDTANAPMNNTVFLSKKTLFSFFKADDNDKHSRFKKALTTLHRQSIFEVREVNEKGKINFKIISPISSSEWNDYNDIVAIKFTEDIMPYLMDLKRNFTQYLITDIMELNSKYSIVLYKWFSMNYNQYETYKDTIKRTKIQINQMKNPYIEMQELRRITNTVNEYERIFDFEKNILKLALEEINKHTHFIITYDKIKKGRSIVGIQFYIGKKIVKSPLPYKENDLESIKSKAQNEQEEQNLFNKAVQNKYTTLLGENLLIGFRDMQDVSKMANLQKQVYPLYDDLKKLRGINGVKEHIKYVANHKIGAEKQMKNIVRYLKRSVEQYLQIVKLQDID